MKIANRMETLSPSVTMAITALGRELKAQGKDILSFSAGEPDFDTPEIIKQAAIKAINAGHTKYTAVEGIIATKQAIINKLKKGVKFAYVKNQTLFFVLTHPVYKMEFEYNKADIKSLLKTFKIANVEDIGFFITNVIEKKEKEIEPTPLYKERSYGIFDNKAKDEYIFKKFEKIREIIKNS